jgi:hypothetical protein
MSKNDFPKIVWEKLCIDSIIEIYGLPTFKTFKNLLR